MNEISNITKLENMMSQLIEIQMDTSKDVKLIDTKVNKIEKRVADIENNYEITTQQRTTIRKTVTKQVYKLLGLPEDKRVMTLEDRVIMQKYSQMFHQRCYAEVARKGHLGSPYGTTTSQNFIPAIKDIEAWIPSNGIEGLKAEADMNRKAKKMASA